MSADAFFKAEEPTIALINRRLEDLLAVVPRWTAAHAGNDAMHHAVFAGGGGKRVRPLLALLSAELQGAPAEDALDPGCAIELIHNYTLVIDDIQDKDDIRRGAPATHAKFGLDDALLAAGRLLLEGAAILHRQTALAPTLINELVHHVHAGQEADIASERWSAAERTPEALNFIFRGKTGALFELAVLAGAGMRPLDNTTAQRLRAIGSDLGYLFQATDDYLEHTSSSEALGKPAKKDRGGKLTYMSFHPTPEGAWARIQEIKDAIRANLAALAPARPARFDRFLDAVTDRTR